MRLRRMQPGYLSGSVHYGRSGRWSVSVSRFLGNVPEHGYRWQTVPVTSIFRVDVLTRQLAAAGIPVDVELRDGELYLAPRNKKGRIAPEGACLKRFMARNYGTFGSDHRPVNWGWSVAQID